MTYFVLVSAYQDRAYEKSRTSRALKCVTKTYMQMLFHLVLFAVTLIPVAMVILLSDAVQYIGSCFITNNITYAAGAIVFVTSLVTMIMLLVSCRYADRFGIRLDIVMEVVGMCTCCISVGIALVVQNQATNVTMGYPATPVRTCICFGVYCFQCSRAW